MPVVLILAFVASLGIHAALMFGPEIELSSEVETPPLMAELRPMPLPPPQLDAPAKPAKPSRPKAARRKIAPVTSASPVLSTTAQSPLSTPDNAAPAALASASVAEPAPAIIAPPVEPVVEPAGAPAVARLPPRGMIRYRVDRGDSNFEIGFAQHEWSIAEGRYRLTSVAETTGIVWLFKSIRVEMESRGLITAEGLRPEAFAILRDGRPTKETADFDWNAMTVRVADHAEQPLDEGAQDLLSFNYQLGYLPQLAAGSTLHIATGKKYDVYPLEVLGDEVIELPAGDMRTLHLRAPGNNTTELWLAYEYLLLPVKIRYVDAKGDSFVQVATKIQVGDETGQNRDQKREYQRDEVTPR